MDWGAANAAMKAVRGYQEAFKKGRMDLVEKQKQLYESAMQTLQTGTNIQQMRQTMDIQRAAEGRTQQLFPSELSIKQEQAKQAPITTRSMEATTSTQEMELQQLRDDVAALKAELGIKGVTPSTMRARETIAGTEARTKESRLAGTTAEERVKAGQPAAEAAMATTQAQFGTEQAQEMMNVGAARMAAERFAAENNLGTADANIKYDEIRQKQQSGYYDALWKAQQDLIPLLVPKEQAEINRLNREATQETAANLRLMRQIEMDEKMEAYIDAKYGAGHYTKMMANKMMVEAGIGMSEQDYITQLRILTTAASSIQSRATTEEVVNDVKSKFGNLANPQTIAWVGGMISGGGGQALSPKDKAAAISRITQAKDALVKRAAEQGYDLTGFLEPIPGGSAKLESELDKIMSGEK